MSRLVTPVAWPASVRTGAVGLVLCAVLTGCGAGGLPATTPPSIVPTAATSPVAPTPDPAVVAPPAATVSGTAGGPGPGTLGSYTWNDAGTDAPWIVPREASRAAPGARLEIAFEPALTAASWTARWARVTGSEAGDVVSGLDGSGPVVVSAPDDTGGWSLQLEARFGQGRSATWYWRVDVGP